MKKIKYIIMIFGCLFCFCRQLVAQTLVPAKNTTNVCVDTQFKLTFNTAPVLQRAGNVRLYESNGTLISTINMTQRPSGTPMSATWPWTESLNGTSINVFRAVMESNTAIFSFPIGSMQYDRNYYVTVDQDVFSNATSLGFSTIGANQWAFRVKSQPTADLDYTVAADGSGDFATLQGALDFIPANNTNAAKIYVKNGIYVGLAFTRNKHNIILEGESADGTHIKGYNNSNLNASTHWRSTVNFAGNDWKILNISFTNTTPNGGSQAEAIKFSGDRCVMVGCKFYSYQDTQLLEGKVYLKDCFIEGDVDFVWGTGTVFFQSCELRANDNSGYNVMARNDNTKHGYAFADCKLTRKSTATTTQYLGRDAGTGYPYAEIVYLNCAMDSHIPTVGWQIRAEMDGNLMIFAEYRSTNLAGTLLNVDSRHAKSRQLTTAQNTQYRDLNWFFNGWTPVVPDVNQPAEIIKQGAGSSFQTIDLGQSIQSFNFAWTNATTITVSGVPTGILATIDNTAKTVTFSGKPTVSGTFTYTITTTGGNPNATRSGTFTVIDPLQRDCNNDINGTAHLDNCDVCVGGTTGFEPCSGSLEAEDACLIDGVILENINAGFSGEGYANTDNLLGASIAWVFNSTTNQTATLTFRYANGGATSRNGEIKINGMSLGTLYSPSTGAWTNWALSSVNLNFVQGLNTLEITATSDGGLANLDIIHFTAGISNAGCTITSIDDFENNDLHIYPNPTYNTVQWDSEQEWILTNINGIKLNSGKGIKVDLSTYPSGQYLLQLGNIVKVIIKE